VLAKMVKAKLRLMPYLFAQVSRYGRAESDCHVADRCMFIRFRRPSNRTRRVSR
jgi:hypothetical protein